MSSFLEKLLSHQTVVKTAFPSQVTLKLWLDTIISIYQQELGRYPDTDGLAAYLINASNGWDSDKIRASVKSSDEYKNLHEPKVIPITKVPYPTSINGYLLRDSDGNYVTVKGFTSFNLLDLFSKGQDVRPIIAQYAGFNTVRCFLYTPVADWKDTAWGIPSNEVTLDFIHFLNDNNLSLFLSLITDNDSSVLPRVRDLIQFLSHKGLSNVIFEAVNEPFIHDKIDPQDIKSELEASDIPYSSGIYTDNRKFYGRVWFDHPDANQWYRRGHNLMEARNGGGPNFPDEPALRIPCIEGELARPDQTGYDYLAYYSYAASTVLFGCGGVFHSQSGKWSRVLDENESKCKDFYLRGLNVFPAGAALGAYRRIDEKDQPDGARTYVVGNYSLRIKQNGTNHPEAGWHPLDEFGIAWMR